MRYDVKKFLFIGVDVEKELFFQKAQEAGIIHFIDPRPSQSKEIPIEVDRLAKAIKVLRGLPVKPQEEIDEYEVAEGLAQKILTLKERLETIAEQDRALQLEISRVEVFGDFSLETIAYIEREGKCKVQFFCGKQGVEDHIVLPEELIYVDSDHGLDYFVAINEKPKQYPKLIEMNIEHPWGELRLKHLSLIKEQQESEKRLKDYQKYSTFLHHALIYKLNTFHLQSAQKLVQKPMDEGLFVVEGWVPVHKIPELHKLAEAMDVHVEEIAVEEADSPPTYLENKGVSRIGEDLVHIYDTPSISDKDPSLWVLVFFSLFFAMIIGDGGYGLIFLLTALYIWFKSHTITKQGKRVLTLVAILSFSCIAWGVLTSSFFGLTIPPDSPLRKFSLMEWLVEKKAEYHIQNKDATYQELVKKYPQLAGVTVPKEFLMKGVTEKAGKIHYDVLNKFTDNIMMELALFVGVLHVIISMVRDLYRRLSGIGWIIFLIGCYIVVPEFLGATSIIHFVFHIPKSIAHREGLYLIYGGVAIAVIIALFKDKIFGLLEGMTVIQIFGDVLSYLRLYALGLSGSLLTATIYDLADPLGFVFGGLLIFAGHLVNMTLGIMGGVIHGLRLNFLEWYHYSFEGGGKVFNPLKKVEIER